MIRTTIEDRVQEGAYFFAGSGRLNLGASGNIRIVFENPKTSKYRIVISRVIIGSASTEMRFAELFLFPTTGLPTTVRLSRNLSPTSSRQSSAFLKIDLGSPLDGGIITGIVFPIPAKGIYECFQNTTICEPGYIHGINIPFSDNSDLTVVYEWWEEVR